jgi:hypothetical protein
LLFIDAHIIAFNFLLFVMIDDGFSKIKYRTFKFQTFQFTMARARGASRFSG